MSKRISKFDARWQAIRTAVRKDKDPAEKIRRVMDFFNTYPNKGNFERIKNWLKMTSVAYKEEAVRQLFKNALVDLEAAPLSNDDDNLSLPDVLSDHDLIAVYKDLSKRKYGFQFKKVPQDHIDFMAKLEDELKTRNIKL